MLLPPWSACALRESTRRRARNRAFRCGIGHQVSGFRGRAAHAGGQWVLSLPKRLRDFLHRDTALAGKVLRIFLEEVERELRRRFPGAGAKARTGAVVFPHRFGASLNAHYHFHACVIEALYEAKGEGVRFHAAAELSDAAIAQVQERVRRRVLKAFACGVLIDVCSGS